MATIDGYGVQVFIEGQEAEIETIGGHLWFASRRGCEFSFKIRCPFAPVKWDVYFDDVFVRQGLGKKGTVHFKDLKVGPEEYRALRFVEAIRKPGQTIDRESFGRSTVRFELFEATILRRGSSSRGPNFTRTDVGKDTIDIGSAIDPKTRHRYRNHKGRHIKTITLYYGPRGLLDDRMFAEEERARQGVYQKKRPAPPHEDAPAAKRPRLDGDAGAAALPLAATRPNVTSVRIHLATPGDTLTLALSPEYSLAELRRQLEQTAPTRLPLRFVFFSPATGGVIDLKDEKLTLMRAVAPEVFLRVAPKAELVSRAAPEVIELD